MPGPLALLARRRRRTMAALALVLGTAALWPSAGAAAFGDRTYFSGFGVEVQYPIGVKVTLASLATCELDLRYCLDFPLLTVGVDMPGRWPPEGSADAGFVQAPLLGFLVALPALESKSPGLKAAGLLLTGLAGGTFHWAPGSEGNLVLGQRGSLTVSFVAKSEIAVHPFSSPRYVRFIPGWGLALTALTGSPAGVAALTCVAGGFTSLAVGSGRRVLDPGIWGTCRFGGY
jgi:hypothetical protein